MKKKLDNTFDMGVDSSRAIKTLREQAMPTIFEAIVELLTNTDDSYEALSGKLNDYKGDCRIEYKRGGKQNPTILKIKDKAMGMSCETMLEKLTIYLKKVTTTSRSFFGKGFKDVTALGDIKVKSIHDNKYSEIHIAQTLEKEKNRIIERNTKVTKNHTKDLGVKKHGTTIEIVIPAGSKDEYNPQASTLIRKLPLHYALSKMLDKKEGTMNLTFYDAGKKQEEKLFYTMPQAKLVVDEKTSFHDGSSANLKIYRFDDILEENIEKKFQTTGISVYGKKACHEKTFFEKTIENNDLKDRYFGTLECHRISELLEEFDRANSQNEKHPPHNNVPIIDTERLHGLNRNHPFVKNHLYKWASSHLKKLLDEDKKKGEGNKGFNDKEMKKYIDDIFKICSKELEMDDETGEGDSGSLGRTQWKVIPKGGKLNIGESINLRVYTYEENLKVGFNEVEIMTDNKSNSIIKIDKSEKKLLPLENRSEIFSAKFTIEAIKEGEQIFKIMHAGMVKTEFKFIVERLKNRDFKNDIEFEHDSYSVGLNKNRNIKVFARVPELLDDEKECNITIDDEQVIKKISNCTLSLVKGTNYAEGTFKLKGLKLNGSTGISASLSGEIAKTKIKVTDKEDVGLKYTWDIGPHEIASKRATWDSERPNILLISTKNQTIKRYLGSETQPYPNIKSAAWKVMLNEIICEKFGEKKVQLTARNDPMQYGDVAKQPLPEDVMKQAEVHFTKAKDLFVSKLMNKILSDNELKLKIE